MTCIGWVYFSDGREAVTLYQDGKGYLIVDRGQVRPASETEAKLCLEIIRLQKVHRA